MESNNFVEFELARELWSKGFNELTSRIYRVSSRFNFKVYPNKSRRLNSDSDGSFYAAPTIEHVEDWLFREHGLHVSETLLNGVFYGRVESKNSSSGLVYYSKVSYDNRLVGKMDALKYAVSKAKSRSLVLTKAY